MKSCDPLTRYEHACYPPHRSNTNLTISRRNKNPGKPTRPTRELNVLAHPNGPRAGPRLKRPAPSPHPIESRAPSLTPRRWMVHRLNTGSPSLIETLPICALPDGCTVSPALTSPVTSTAPLCRAEGLRALAGLHRRSHIRRKRVRALPSWNGRAPWDSTVVVIYGGSGFALPPHREVERHW